MKKSYVKILALIPLFALSSCRSDEGKVTGVSAPEVHSTNTIDTMRVTGVFDAIGGGYMPSQYKFVKCIDKNNKAIDYVFNVTNNPKNDIAYAERGDTILMNGNKFVKNLTQERIRSEFVNGR